MSSRFSVPHYDLDQLGQGHQAAADYINDAFSIAEQPRWITEGIYLVWTDPMLYRAHFIVLLDVPWPIAASRILRRHIRRSMHGTNPYPGINGLRLLLKLLRYAHRYYTEKANSPAATATLREYFDDGTDANQPPRAEVLLKRFEAHMQVIPTSADFVRLYLKKYRHKVYIVKNEEDRKRLIDVLVASDSATKVASTN